MKKHLLFWIFVSFSAAAIAQYPDILHADYRLEIMPLEKTVKGTAVYDLKKTSRRRTVTLDAHEKVNIREVRSGKKKLSFTHDKNVLTISTPRKCRELTVEIAFETRDPVQAMYFVGWDNGNKNQVWTQGQGKNHSHWMPVIDDVNERFTWDAEITFPAGYRVVSNGVLTEQRTDSTGQKNIYRYRMNKPAPSYLFFIGAGDWNVSTDTINGIPYQTYSYPDAPQPDYTYRLADYIFHRMPRIIGYPFPWETHRDLPLRDFIYGGMENVTASVFTDFLVVNDTAWNDINPVNVIAHELAHQWFGNYITATSPRHHWLHESFATFYAWEAEKEFFGKDYTDFAYYDYLQQIIDAYHGGDTVPLLNGKASTLTFYQKGAWIIRMLRDKIGNDNFQSVVRHFLENHPYQNVTTSDFKRSLHAVTGDSLNDFFEHYFESPHIPAYSFRRSADTLFAEGDTDIPLPVRIYYSDGSYRDVTAGDTLLIPGYSRYAFYLPDPGRRHLAELHWEPSLDEIRLALHTLTENIDIYRFIIRLENESLENKYPLLLQWSAKNAYYPVHAAVIYQIREAPDSLIVPVVRNILRKDLKNRQTVATGLDRIPAELQPEAESLLDDPSYTTIAAALWKLWNAFPRRRHYYLDKTQGKTGFNDRDLRMLWILMAVSDETYLDETRKWQLIEELIRYASPDFNVETRMTALDYLDMLGLINEHTLPYIRQAAGYFHPALSRKARAILKKYGLEE